MSVNSQAQMLGNASISIALVNYKTVEATSICLDLIQRVFDVKQVPVWVVDNQSNDESTHYLRSLDWIHFIERVPNGVENGFMAHGRALDLILDKVTTKYLLLMHTDTFIYDITIIEKMLQKISSNQQVAAVGCLEQVYRSPFELAWRVPVRAVKYYFRKLKLTLGLKTREPRLFYEIYFKSFCALWNVDIIRRHNMSFAMVERIPGYEMQDQLRQLGYSFEAISPREMFRYLDHIEAGTVSLVRGRTGSHKRIKNYQAIIDKNRHK